MQRMDGCMHPCSQGCCSMPLREQESCGSGMPAHAVSSSGMRRLLPWCGLMLWPGQLQMQMQIYMRCSCMSEARHLLNQVDNRYDNAAAAPARSRYGIGSSSLQPGTEARLHIWTAAPCFGPAVFECQVSQGGCLPPLPQRHWA